jgi:hypothetical protein
MYGPLTTLERVKLWLGQTAVTDDTKLEALIAATGDFVGRQLSRDNLGSLETYVETYFLDEYLAPGRTKQLQLVLDHYPVTTLTSVAQGVSSLGIVTDPAQLARASGVWLERDHRTLRFLSLPSAAPVTITYTAGYAEDEIPQGLVQAATQFVSEIYKSKDWIGYTSKALAGETVSYDVGRVWGASPRTRAMFQPYVNRIPCASQS